jgi:hypothetical protein
MPSPTPRIGLSRPALDARDWHLPLDANCDVIDAIAPVGDLAVLPAESPSASLNIKVAEGWYADAGGALTEFAGDSSFALTASATNYVYLDAAGALTANTTGFPTTNCLPLAVAETDGSTVISITDRRVAFAPVGTAGGGAPIGASYVTLATSSTLTAERVLTAGAGITITDGGAGSTVTVALTSPVSIANGGSGQATANAALNAFLPSQTGNNGKVLGTDGTNTSWVATTGTGTVTSVALSAPAELAVGGSPITASGTLALTWASAAANEVFAGPDGSSGTPAFRALVVDDLPAIPLNTAAVTNTLGQGNGGTGFSSYSDADILIGQTSSGGLILGGVDVAGGLTKSFNNTTGRLLIDASGVVAGAGGAPVGATFVTLSLNGTLTNERVLTGTANRVSITDNGANSTVVLSIPQDIHTAATPQFAGVSLSAIATPGSPVTGQLWHDNGQKALRGYLAGASQTFPGVLSVLTSEVVVSNTTTTGALLSLSLPANFFTAGKVLRLRLTGYWTTKASSPGAFDLGVYDSTTRIALIHPTYTPPAGLSGNWWSADVDVVCRVAGASGTIAINGEFRFADTTASYASRSLGIFGTTYALTFDTTISHTLSLKALWATADALNLIAAETGTAEVLG